MKNLVASAAALILSLGTVSSVYSGEPLDRFLNYQERGVSVPCEKSKAFGPELILCPYWIENDKVDFMYEVRTPDYPGIVAFWAFDFDRDRNISDSELFRDPRYSLSGSKGLAPVIPPCFLQGLSSDDPSCLSGQNIYEKIIFFLEKARTKTPALEEKLEIDPSKLVFFDVG